MDALTLVRQEHRKLEELLARTRRLDGETEVERALLLEQLQAALRHHVDQEESILYTIFRERARRAEVGLAPLDRALEQHRVIERLSRGLTFGRPGDAELQARLAVLAEQVEAHLDAEDTVVLSAIEDLLEDDTLLELGRRMEQRDRVIESRRQLATVIPIGTRGRRVAAALGSVVALGTAALAVISRRRRPTPSRRRRRR